VIKQLNTAVLYNLVKACVAVIVFVALIFASSSSAAGDKYVPGREVDALIPGVDLAMKVYVPANYTPECKWPLVIFYHGMNGSPTTDCIARHCEGDDFIIVGMPYCEKHEARLSKQQQAIYIKKEQKSFLSAVSWVKENLSLDTERVFMGGVSKGGWTTSFVGERELKRLAGMIILLAGRQRGAVPGPQAMAGFPIYIGVGEMDPNQLSGVHAAGFYRHCGADVTYEEYEGQGHRTPQKAERLAQWLEAYGPQSHPWVDSEEQARRKTDYKKGYESALALADKSAACAALRLLLDDPRLTVICGSNTRKAITGKLNALAKEDVLAMKLLKAEKTFYNLVWKEWQMRTFDETTVVVGGYSRLSKAATGTCYEIYAEKSYERLLPMYQQAQKQMDQVKVKQKSLQKKAPSRSRMRNSSGTGGGSVF
jgi:predicted esterase